MYPRLGHFQNNKHSGEFSATGARPPKIGSTVYVFLTFCIRMLKNKAQIARESITRAGPDPGCI